MVDGLRRASKQAYPAYHEAADRSIEGMPSSSDGRASSAIRASLEVVGHC
jgi:hypothetical protein